MSGKISICNVNRWIKNYSQELTQESVLICWAYYNKQTGWLRIIEMYSKTSVWHPSADRVMFPLKPVGVGAFLASSYLLMVCQQSLASVSLWMCPSNPSFAWLSSPLWIYEFASSFSCLGCSSCSYFKVKVWFKPFLFQQCCPHHLNSFNSSLLAIWLDLLPFTFYSTSYVAILSRALQHLIWCTAIFPSVHLCHGVQISPFIRIPFLLD